MLMPKNIQVFNIYRDINFYETPCKPVLGDTNNNIPGILISGGKGALTSVEVYSPSQHCELPSLPDIRGGHTSVGTTLCGG